MLEKLDHLPQLTWETLDWLALDRLRNQFLEGTGPSAQSYWESIRDVANYDFTYAQRIGWKWDAVLSQLKQRGWTPPTGPLLDWGCGSGIASRRMLEWFGPESFERVFLWDRSSLAMQFALTRGAQLFPEARLEAAPPEELKETFSGTLVISHVLNELDEAGGGALRSLIDRARAVVWVEPGTFADSRALIAMREALREEFHVIAPCTHQAACGLLTEVNARHWCHHFASPPPGIMGDSDWVRFAQRAGVDLRSLPYSYLVLERRGARPSIPGDFSPGYSRVLGVPRVYKGYARILNCQEGEVSEVELQKRDAPEIFKTFKHGEGETLHRWKVEGNRVRPDTGTTETSPDE